MAYPIPDAALDDRLAVVGTAGSGKTYAAGTAVEKLLDRRARVIVVDPLDVWWGLRLHADGNAAGFPVVIFGGSHADLALNEHAGALIGETVAGMAESCIVSLSTLGTKAAERRFMLAFLTALYRRAAGEPVHVVFDEADMWAPQRLLDKEGDAAKLLGQMETLVRRGRVRGFIPWLITQRPAVVSKDVLSQADGMVAMKLTSSQDRAAIGGWIEGQADQGEGKRILASLPQMQRGQGVVWIPSRGVLATAQFPRKATFDSSRTPSRGEKVKTAALKPINLDALKGKLATVEAEAKANDPRELKAKIAKLESDARRAQPAADPQAEKRGYRRGKIDGYADALRLAEPFIPKLRQIATIASELAQGIEQWSHRKPEPAISSRPVASVAPPSARVVPDPGNAEVGQGGLRRIMIALAQCPRGLSNRQIGVRAGISSKSGTFSTYLSRARQNGWIEGRGTVKITPAGDAALGAYDPLPTGAALLDHWLRELGDGGASRLLRAIADAYPNTLSNAEAGARAGLSSASGTFSTYLSRLRTLELVEGRGALKASDDLFDGAR